MGFGMLQGYRTYITAALTGLGAVLGYLMGDVSLVDAAQLVATALMGTFIRAGVAKAS